MANIGACYIKILHKICTTDKYNANITNMDCKEVMSCVFNINMKEIELYKFLVEKEEMRVEEIAKAFKKDRSTIQRSLKKLMDCMLVERKKKIMGKGGYYYTYKAVPPANAKNFIKVCLEDWYKRMANAIENFENDFK